MSLRKKVDSARLKVWTASRILKDSARAEEVIQDALIKVMLAAPELDSADDALGYMHRTIENLCIDIFRIEGRRPGPFELFGDVCVLALDYVGKDGGVSDPEDSSNLFSLDDSAHHPILGH